MIKSEKYTQGEFKAVKDLINLEDSLLHSSQMANSLLLLNQHEKMIKNATQAINQKSNESSGIRAPEPAASDDTTDADATAEASREQEEDAADAPPAPAQDDNEVLANMNAQLKNLLM